MSVTGATQLHSVGIFKFVKNHFTVLSNPHAIPRHRVLPEPPSSTRCGLELYPHSVHSTLHTPSPGTECYRSHPAPLGTLHTPRHPPAPSVTGATQLHSVTGATQLHSVHSTRHPPVPSVTECYRSPATSRAECRLRHIGREIRGSSGPERLRDTAQSAAPWEWVGDLGFHLPSPPPLPPTPCTV